MKTPRKASTKQRGFFIGLLIVLLGIAGGAVYHHHEYQNLYFTFPSGGGATMSRHNFNMMTAAQKQSFLHPVDENSLHPCTGNPSDQCKSTPSIDFWPAGSEGATNTTYVSNKDDVSREIMGRITSTNGNSLLIKTSSGKVFTIAYPVDALGIFNNTVGPNYPVTVTISDTIFVNYSEDASRYETTINPSQITRTSLILANTKSKTQSEIQKY